MMDLKGRFNTKMIKKARFGDTYFDDLGSFQNVESDRVTGAVSQEVQTVLIGILTVFGAGCRAPNSCHKARAGFAGKAHAPCLRQVERRGTEDIDVIHRPLG